jgi:hypothetical protein
MPSLMSNLVPNTGTKLELIMPDAEPVRTDERYPRALIVSGVLTFSLTVWTVVILALAYWI